jgi:hypothetical protein
MGTEIGSGGGMYPHVRCIPQTEKVHSIQCLFKKICFGYLFPPISIYSAFVESRGNHETGQTPRGYPHLAVLNAHV